MCLMVYLLYHKDLLLLVVRVCEAIVSQCLDLSSHGKDETLLCINRPCFIVDASGYASIFQVLCIRGSREGIEGKFKTLPKLESEKTNHQRTNVKLTKNREPNRPQVYQILCFRQKPYYFVREDISCFIQTCL